MRWICVLRKICVHRTAALPSRASLPLRRAGSPLNPSNQIYNSVRKRFELLGAIEVADAATDSLADSPDDKHLLRQYTHDGTCK
jgi:hypothetical protein